MRRLKLEAGNHNFALLRVGDLRPRLQMTLGRELFVRVQVDVELYESE